MVEITPLSQLRTRPSRKQPPARPIDVRRHNLALVLKQVATHGSISRAELAGLTRLTKGTVSTLVQELLRLELLVELGVQQDGRVGRPRSVLTLNGNYHCGIGLEINVDYVAVCVADLLQRVRFHRVEIADNRNADLKHVLDDAARLVKAALTAANAEGLSAAALEVAVPGTIGIDAGRVLVAPNLGWSDVAIVDELRRRLRPVDLPVLADNDANLAALGELWLGVGAESGDYVHVSGEIGIGAGFVVGGALFRGSRGFAGEIGHIVLEPNGPLCSCGGHGCLEVFAGQDAILRAAGLPMSASTSLVRMENPVRGLIGLLESGNPRATDAVQSAGTMLGVALADVVNVLDPDTIVLGGTYASLTPWLIEPLRRALESQVIASDWRPIAVRASALGPDAAVRGAAASVVQRVLAAPGLPVTV